MQTAAEIQTAIFEQTGIKTGISKNKGSMKHHITFRPLFQNGTYPYFNIEWCREFAKNFHPIGSIFPCCSTSQLDIPAGNITEFNPIKYAKERKPKPIEEMKVKTWGGKNSQLRLDKAARRYAKNAAKGNTVRFY